MPQKHVQDLKKALSKNWQLRLFQARLAIKLSDMPVIHVANLDRPQQKFYLRLRTGWDIPFLSLPQMFNIIDELPVSLTQVNSRCLKIYFFADVKDHDLEERLELLIKAFQLLTQNLLQEAEYT